MMLQEQQVEQPVGWQVMLQAGRLHSSSHLKLQLDKILRLLLSLLVSLQVALVAAAAAAVAVVAADPRECACSSLRICIAPSCCRDTLDEPAHAPQGARICMIDHRGVVCISSRVAT